MKQPRQDSIINNIRKIGKSYRQAMFLLIAFAVFTGCKNDLEKIQLFEEETTVPSLSMKEVTLLRSDSGKLVVRIEAPVIKRFENVDEPFMEFPEGVDVYFLDSVQEVKTHITANYAIRYEEQYLYYAQDSVVATNFHTGEWIKSEEMYWDEKKGTVYSDKFTTIKRTDGMYYGREGFEAEQDFSSWKLKKPTATLTVDEE